MRYALSPATLAGMKVYAQPGLFEPEEEKDIHVEAVTVYECPDCGEQHDREREAVECCAEQRAKDRAAGVDGKLCPVCGEEYEGPDNAVDCCLWHDLDWPTRHGIARAVEAGSTWAEQLL